MLEPIDTQIWGRGPRSISGTMSLDMDAFLGALEVMSTATSERPNTIFVRPEVVARIRLRLRMNDIVRTLFGKRAPTQHQIRKIRFPDEMRGMTP
jgi:hypothetical protein